MTSPRCLQKASSIDELEDRDSLINVLEVEVLSLRSQIKKSERRVEQRLGNIETVISEIQEKLSINNNVSNIANEVVSNITEKNKLDSAITGKNPDFEAPSIPSWIEVHGLKVKKFEDPVEIEKKFHFFLRETLGLSWEQVRALSISECMSTEVESSNRIKGVKETKVLVRFDRTSDVELLNSRLAIAQVQGYVVNSFPPRSKASVILKKNNKKLMKAASG